MEVVIATRNPVKIRAVKNVFSKFYKNFRLKSVEYEYKKQPVGLSETIIGAIKRACFAFEYGDMGIGIEAGLVEIPYTISGYFDIQFCAIINEEGLTLGCGMGFEYPRIVVNEALKGEEVGKIMEKISGIKNIGKNIGAIGFLSKGIIDREKLTEQAVLSALIPRINKTLYGDFLKINPKDFLKG